MLTEALRIIAGTVLVFYLPGYFIVYALFDEGELGGIEKIGLRIGFSVMAVIFLGLIIDRVWEISLVPILSSITVISLLFFTIGKLKRRHRSEKPAPV
jgi:uncharacterized membrane protein